MWGLKVFRMCRRSHTLHPPQRHCASAGEPIPHAITRSGHAVMMPLWHSDRWRCVERQPGRTTPTPSVPVNALFLARMLYNDGSDLSVVQHIKAFGTRFAEGYGREPVMWSKRPVYYVQVHNRGAAACPESTTRFAGVHGANGDDGKQENPFAESASPESAGQIRHILCLPPPCLPWFNLKVLSHDRVQIHSADHRRGHRGSSLLGAGALRT